MNQLDEKFRLSLLMYILISSSVLIPLGLTEILPRLGIIKPVMGEQSTSGILRYVFYIFGILMLFSTKYVEKTFLSQKENDEEKIIQKLQTSTLLIGLLNEMMAVIGFMVFMLSRNKMDFYIMLIVSIVSFLINFPKKEKWEEIIRSNKL